MVASHVASVYHRLWVWIPFKPEFFLTAVINHVFIIIVLFFTVRCLSKLLNDNLFLEIIFCWFLWPFSRRLLIRWSYPAQIKQPFHSNHVTRNRLTTARYRGLVKSKAELPPRWFQRVLNFVSSFFQARMACWSELKPQNGSSWITTKPSW